MHQGPQLAQARLRLELDDCELAEVRLNGELCQPAPGDETPVPGPARGFQNWQEPPRAGGVAVIDVKAAKAGKVH